MKLISNVDFLVGVDVSAVGRSERSASCHGRQQHSQVVMETASASRAQRPSTWISGIHPCPNFTDW